MLRKVDGDIIKGGWAKIAAVDDFGSEYLGTAWINFGNFYCLDGIYLARIFVSGNQLQLR
jgi:hypothetical protein